MSKGFAEYISDEKCPECGKNIIKAWTFGIEISKMCECEEARANAEREKNIELGRAIIRAGMRKESGMLKKWQERRILNFNAKQGQEAAYNAAVEFINSFTSQEGASRGIIFSGVAGCGKTHLAAAVANAIIDMYNIPDYNAQKAGEQKIYHDDFTPARFVSTVELFSRIKASYDANEPTMTVVRPYQRAMLTVIDDLGTEKPTEWAKERLFEIVDYRYSAELPMVITTNQIPIELKKQIGDRTYDRLREMCKLIPITAPGQRVTA